MKHSIKIVSFFSKTESSNCTKTSTGLEILWFSVDNPRGKRPMDGKGTFKGIPD